MKYLLPHVQRLGLTVLALALFLVACDSDDSPTDPVEPENTIADVVAEDPDFSTLLSILQSADLVDTFADPEATFTVFAPLNSGFLPYDVTAIGALDGAIEEILTYHVVAGAAVGSGDLQDGQRVQTLAGDELLVRIDGSGGVTVDGSRVVTADVQTDNGVIHVIDRVMVGNQNLANVAGFILEIRTLFEVVVDVGLADAFAGADDWTVFAPNNAAFAALGDALDGLSEAEIQEILQYHVLPGGITRSDQLIDLLQSNGGEVSVPTAQGEEVTITLVDASTIAFNGDQALLDLDNLDYFAENGIIHLIDGVLLPPSFTDEG